MFYQNLEFSVLLVYNYRFCYPGANNSLFIICPIAAKSGYLDMHHKKDSVEEAYVKGRPTQRESDYEITSGQKGLVDEVLPEDDVAPGMLKWKKPDTHCKAPFYIRLKYGPYILLIRVCIR